MPKLYYSLCFMCALVLTGCNVSNHISDFNTPAAPQKNVSFQSGRAMNETKALASWWSYFGDETLDILMKSAMNLQTQNVDGHVSKGGANTIEALTTRLTDKKSVLVENIVRLYIQYRSLQGQDMALDEFISQRKSLAHRLNADNGAVEHALKSDIENEITEAEKAKYVNTKEAAEVSLALAKAAGLLPEYVSQVLKNQKPLPAGDITPILGTSALAFTIAPQMQAFQSYHNGSVDSLGAVFPQMMIGEFFGVSGEVYVDQNSPWQVKAGTFVRNLDLSSIPQNEKGSELQDNIASSLFRFQGLLIHYSELGTQYKTLNKAYDKANEDYDLLKNKYLQDGDFMMAVMDKQKDLYKTKTAALKAHYERTKVLVDVYAYFGVY